MSYAAKIELILLNAQCDPVPLAAKAVWDWQRQWRQVYAAQLHAETGKWVHNGYDWHVFSFGKYEHVQGDRAWSAFRRIGSGPFLVLSADIQHTFGFSCNGTPTERLDSGIDIVVAPPSMEWTMAFNHEHYGPYFAASSREVEHATRD